MWVFPNKPRQMEHVMVKYTPGASNQSEFVVQHTARSVRARLKNGWNASYIRPIKSFGLAELRHDNHLTLTELIKSRTD